MTDDPVYAVTYVKNEEQVVEVTVSRFTLMQMQNRGDIVSFLGVHGGLQGFEYKISPVVAPDFVKRFNY